tara:strand:- start:8284 stop:8532 length:249 start_codon:yes stop_codon:yes gene_type:complete
VPVEKNEKHDNEVLKQLGERIVELRKDKGLKQIELAVKLGIEDSALRRIESGRTNPTTKTLLSIARELDVTIIDLFSFIENK